MEDLVFLKNDQAVCTSLQVAEKFHKRHDRVIRSIEQIKENSSPQNWGQSFKVSSYTDASGKQSKMYLMNRDGFSILAMGFTGKEALDWKWKYIRSFDAMESILSERSTEQWIESRKTGKLTRQSETDTIKRLIEYAKSQGSEHADMLYMTYSKLANKMAGIHGRDSATTQQLNNLSIIENIILHVIDQGIVDGIHYKQIYVNCKLRLQQFREIAYLEETA